MTCIGNAAQLLCQMRENLLNAQNTAPKVSYGPIRKRASIHPENAPHLKNSVLQKFYPVGTTVRYNQKDYEIMQFFGKSTVRISRNGKNEIVPIAKLKPKVKIEDRVLILTPQSSPKEHTIAKIKSVARGHVIAIREEFDQTEASASINQISALARVIPIKEHSLEALATKQVAYKTTDGSTIRGTVYELLKED